MKTLRESIANAVGEMSAIRFFPTSEDARFAIMRALEGFIQNPRELRWLVDTAIERMDQWAGVPALRAIFAERPRSEEHPGPECTGCSGTGWRPVQRSYRGELVDAVERCGCWSADNPAPLESG